MPIRSLTRTGNPRMTWSYYPLQPTHHRDPAFLLIHWKATMAASVCNNMPRFKPFQASRSRPPLLSSATRSFPRQDSSSHPFLCLLVTTALIGRCPPSMGNARSSNGRSATSLIWLLLVTLRVILRCQTCCNNMCCWEDAGQILVVNRVLSNSHPLIRVPFSWPQSTRWQRINWCIWTATLSVAACCNHKKDLSMSFFLVPVRQTKYRCCFIRIWLPGRLPYMQPLAR